MKRLLIIGVVVVSFFFLAACAPTYQVTMKNGDIYETKTEPVVDKESGYVEYMDKKNKKVKLKEEDVVMIQEK